MDAMTTEPRTITYRSDGDCYCLIDTEDGEMFPAFFCGGCVKISSGYAGHEYEVHPIYSHEMRGDESCDTCLARL